MHDFIKLLYASLVFSELAPSVATASVQISTHYIADFAPQPLARGLHSVAPQCLDNRLGEKQAMQPAQQSRKCCIETREFHVASLGPVRTSHISRYWLSRTSDDKGRAWTTSQEHMSDRGAAESPAMNSQASPRPYIGYALSQKTRPVCRPIQACSPRPMAAAVISGTK